MAAQVENQVLHLVVGEEADDLRARHLQGDGRLLAAGVHAGHHPAGGGLERPHQLAGPRVLQGAGVAFGEHVDGERRQLAALEAGGLVLGAFGGDGVERGAADEELLHLLGVGLARRHDLAQAQFLRGRLVLEHLLVEAVDRVAAHRLADRAFQQDVAQHALARGSQSALGRRILLKAPADRLGGEEFLVHHLVEHLTEDRRGRIQGLALADQALGDGLALDVRSPDRRAVDARHRLVAGLGRALGGRPLRTGGQCQEEEGGNARAPGLPRRQPCIHGTGRPRQ